MRKNLAITSIIASVFLAALATSVPNVALPALGEEFEVAFAEAKWIIISYLLSNTLFVVIAGGLGDAYGPPKVLKLGLVLYSGASLLSALSPTFTVLIAARVLQGTGAAALLALSLVLAGEVAPKNKSGRTMGLIGSASAVGTASGPALGGLLLATLGWRSIFVLMSGLGVLVFVVMQSAQLGKTEVPSSRLPLTPSLEVGANLIMNFLVSAVMMTTLIVGPSYLTQQLSLTAGVTGLVMTVGPVLSILSGFPAGRLVEKIGARKVMGRGLFFLVLGALSFAILPEFVGISGFIVSAVFLSPGYQMFQASNNSIALAKAPENERGTVAGFLNLARNLGLATGAWMMGNVYGVFGIAPSFLLAAVLAFAALLLSIRFQGDGK